MTMTSALCICVVQELFSYKNQTTFYCCLKWCSKLIFKYNDADLVSCDDSRIIKRSVLLMFAVSGAEWCSWWRVLSGHQSTGADPAIIKIKTENCTTLSVSEIIIHHTSFITRDCSVFIVVTTHPIYMFIESTGADRENAIIKIKTENCTTLSVSEIIIHHTSFITRDC